MGAWTWLAIVACRDPTQLVVAVQTDLSAPDQIDGFAVVVEADDGRPVRARGPGGARYGVTLPISSDDGLLGTFGVAPLDSGDATDALYFEVRVTGFGTLELGRVLAFASEPDATDDLSAVVIDGTGGVVVAGLLGGEATIDGRTIGAAFRSHQIWAHRLPR